MFNRNDAFSFEIKDANNQDEVDPINSSIVVNNELFVIKENSIYRIMTAETIDPECKHLDTTIPALPQIPDLDSSVQTYLNNSKLFLIECFRLLSMFYKMPFDGRKSAHFNKHLEWVKKHLGAEHNIAKMISSDLDWIRLISECRNALEHPEEGQEVRIRNLTLLAGNKFSGPSWSYDLTNKLNIKYNFVDLINDLSIFSHNMLNFFEDFLLLCVKDKLTERKILDLGKIPEQEIDSKCPIRYKVTLKENNITKKCS